METVKLAGFKTQGPPTWAWYALKAATINKLRSNKPPSGLVLTETAVQKYNLLNEQEQKKLEVKKQFDQAKKAAKKLSKDPAISGLTELVIPAKGYIGFEDLPPLAVVWLAPVFVRPDSECFLCGDPLYGYPDYEDVCLWCAAGKKVK